MYFFWLSFSPSKLVHLSKGLKQGDPFPPFLFLIVVEGLKGLMNMASLPGSFTPYMVWKNEIKVSLLQFADDIVFCG